MIIKILLADDHSVVRQGLRMFLTLDPELQVLGEAANGAEAVALAETLKPDVVLMDLLMPVMSGLDATAAIRARADAPQVIILTSVMEDAAVTAVFRAGAVGYLLKSTEADELRRAIKEAAAGHPQFSPQVAARLLMEAQQTAGQDAFTDQEAEVLRLAAQGLSHGEIAGRLLVPEPAVHGAIGGILDKLRLADQAQAALLEFSNQLLSRPDSPALMTTLVQETQRLLATDACAVLLLSVDRQSLVFRAASGWRQDPVASGRRLALHWESAVGAGQVMRTGQAWQTADLATVVADSAREAAADAAAAWLDEGFRGHALIPLVAEGRVVGVLALNSRRPRRLSDEEIRFLRLLANQAALVLVQARLLEAERVQHGLEEDLAVARQIQLSLLPEHSPQMSGWEFAAAYRAAQQVGGDLYDFVELPGTPPRLGLLIADVSGKGAAAALFMAHTRAVVRAAALTEKGPAAALELANAQILKDNQTSHFVSAFYGVLDTASGRLTFANGGHNRPLWWRAAAGDFTELNSQGIVLGLLPAVELEELEKSLAPGDLVVLYTDGITEAINPAEELFGEARLRGAIAAVEPKTPQRVVDAILEAVQAFSSGAPQADDFTLVAVRRLADGG
ncbi:MAG: SpoIIE family protein phosphatase [Anaerolineales bacterium]|nr:SpoIIE family protein phosphatase [Anaerolineales bacterium]